MDNNEIQDTYVESKESPEDIKHKHYFAITGDGVPQKMLKYDLVKEITIAGRDDSCDLVLNDPKISRKHLKIIIEDPTTVRILDLGSSNGTYINEVKIDNRKLKYGDEILIGKTKLKYFYADAEDTGRKIYDLG